MHFNAFTCGIEYHSKSAVAEVCRSIIARNYGKLSLSVKDAQFVGQLFERHPDYLEKSSPGISGFMVATDTRWGTTRHFVAMRTDGTFIDFSWKICIDGQLPSRRVCVLAAMREAVADQILAFREKAFGRDYQLICPITGRIVTIEDSHVDHALPKTFVSLADFWLMAEKKSFETIKLCRAQDGYGWELSDSLECKSWQSFHARNASLRMVSRQANLSELKRKNLIPIEAA
jgi:hypothetical protein